MNKNWYAICAFMCTLIITLSVSSLGIGSQLVTAQFYADNSGNNDNGPDVFDSETDSGGAQIVLLSQKLKKGYYGYNDIVGQVKNIGNGHATYVQIGLSTYDKDGGVVGTDSTYTTADKLKPNQKSTFDIMSSKDNFKKMSYYELSLQWRNPDDTDQYVENAQLYQTGTDANSNGDAQVFKSKGGNDGNDNDKDSSTSHIARDVKNAID